MFDYAAWRSDFADEYVLARDDLVDAEMWWTLADNTKDDNPEFAAKAIITSVKYVIRSERRVVGTVGATGMMQKIRTLTLGIESDFEELCNGEEYELTAEKIVEAWAADDFAGRGITIAFIDRMRQLIWNEPFYVVWAARPEQSG